MGVATPELALNEGRSVGQVCRLSIEVEGEEAADDLTLACSAPAPAWPAVVIVEPVQAVVDGDLLARPYVDPCQHLDAAPHSVGLTGVVEVAAGRQQDRAGLEVQLAQVPPLLVAETADLC